LTILIAKNEPRPVAKGRPPVGSSDTSRKCEPTLANVALVVAALSALRRTRERRRKRQSSGVRVTLL
jgi:hypothetical protein